MAAGGAPSAPPPPCWSRPPASRPPPLLLVPPPARPFPPPPPAPAPVLLVPPPRWLIPAPALRAHPRSAPAPAPLIPPRRGQVLAQVRGRAVQPVQVFPVGGQRGQMLGGHLAEQGDRVVAGPLTAGRVECGKQLPGTGMPRPAQIQHQVVQRGQRLGQRGPDGEGADGSHAERPYTQASERGRHECTDVSLGSVLG